MDQLEYLAYVAATVPPGNLARAAARRIARRASQALRRGQDVAERDVLEAFCAEDPRDLALKLAAPRASQLWADASQRDAVRAAAGRVPGVFERVLSRAELSWQRQFEFFGQSVSFGRGAGGIDWHLDYLNGGRFDPSLAAFDRRLWRPGLDPKAAWATARFEQALWLGQGVWLSHREPDQARWASEFVSQLRHFARENPPGRGINWSCPMEIALRAVNLSLGFLMMRHRPELQEPRFAMDLGLQLAAHGRFVEAHLEHTGAVPNNHYVANLVGLLHLGTIFPELPGALRWRERATEGLRKEIERQVLDDGFSFEGSTSYHRLALELFTLGWLVAAGSRLDLGRGYFERLHSMFRAVRVYLTSSGLAPQIGDNDSGRAIALCPRDSLDHGYLLPLGAALFDDPDLRLEGAPYCDEGLFLLGADGVRRFEALPESMGPQSASLPRAGIYVLRSASSYCAISCGPNGQGGIGGHSHNDKLALEIHAGGRRLVVDPGTLCYTSQPEVRNAFRSTAAHSTLQIDGAEQNRLPAERLFALPDDARARMVRFESSPLQERFLGEHRGYERLQAGLRVRREVVFDRSAKAFLVVDRLEGRGAHRAVARFQLPDALARLRAIEEPERARLQRLFGGRFRAGAAVELGPAEAPLALLVAADRARVRLEPSLYSPGYGTSRGSLCVGVEWDAELPDELGVAILLH